MYPSISFPYNSKFLGHNFIFSSASRVADARELYFTSANDNLTGTPTLKQTTNYEIDLGYETINDTFKFKFKTFYSILEDYIYIQKDVAVNAFVNIDAKIYGAELSGSYFVSDDITFDSGLSYKVGRKDKALSGQSDKDLVDMAPLRANIALNYEYANNSIATVELQASDKWSSIDSDNGEQKISGWAVLNMKVKHAFSKNIELTLGVNNIFDKTYAVNNTYVDLTLITTSGADDVMLMNEVGRYVYTNLTFRF